MKAAGLTMEHVIKLLLLANNDLQSIERKYQNLKREEAAVTAKNLKLQKSSCVIKVKLPMISPT
jgi:hypothetical protein